MWSLRRTRLPKVKPFAVRLLLLLAVGAVLVSVSGCQTDDPENVSVRPWNSPTEWQSGLPVDTGQHR